MCTHKKNMDEAHRAVKLIKNPSVWENMALMCVKTRRLDVAEVCLGQMGFARGAAAVRLARTEAPDEPDVALAAVAIQLGLLSDAEKLYAGRPDLLNKLYQAAGCWDRALELASSSDRIHLKTTHHAYAKHLEDQGNVAAAIDHFEMADTHRVEVPRLLFERKQLSELEDYVLRSKPKVAHHKAGGGSGGLTNSSSSSSSTALLSPNPAAKFKSNPNANAALFSPQSPSGLMSDTGGASVQGPDPALATWWAGYLEATGQFDRAADFYARAHDAFALVRIACFNRDLNAAKKLVDEDASGGGAAAYYLARYLEGVGEVADAINYYASAKCFNHAVSGVLVLVGHTGQH
jgi:intraflagellar transport protein 140